MRFEGESTQEAFSFMQKRAGGPVRPPFEPRKVASLAARGLFLGTSSWRYRGWEGLLYEGGYGTEAHFQRSSLMEYSRLLPTVGVDLTFYSWPTAELVAHFAESTPESFRFCLKASQRLTMPIFPQLPAYGKWAGQENPDYLNAESYLEKFHEPMRRIGKQIGMLQFEISAGQELARWREFFRRIPREWPLALEPKSAELVNPDFYRFILELGLSPAFSLSAGLPSLAAQWKAYGDAGGESRREPLLVLGSGKPGRAPEEAVRLFAPYKEIKDIYEEGRAGIAELGRKALASRREAYFLAHNQLEGSAPSTVAEWAQRMS